MEQSSISGAIFLYYNMKLLLPQESGATGQMQVLGYPVNLFAKAIEDYRFVAGIISSCSSRDTFG